MKSLHVGNLANVAYGACKILKQAGHDLTLAAHDERHLMSQPEWDDLELQSSDFLDEFDFAVNTADFGNYRRPEWFLSGTLVPQLDPIEYLAKRIAPLFPSSVRRRCRPSYHRVMGYKRWMINGFKAGIPRPIKKLIRKPYAVMLEGLYGVIHGRFPTLKKSDAAAANVIRLSNERGPRDTLSFDEVRVFHPHTHWMKKYVAGHDVIVAYVLAPIYAMLDGTRPYVSVEIGTMRDIPFDGSGTGKALALAYQQSDFVLITNPDVITAARRLGLQRYAFCPHPVDEDVYAPCPGGTAFRAELLAKYQAEHLLFAPARQNWEVKANDRYLRAFANVLRIKPKTTLIIPGWGQEVERSQRLCAELGISNRVAWIKPVSERALVKYYQAVDIVLDQFALTTFGLVTGKALATGCAVITSYDPQIHEWCFTEHPPLIRAQQTEEIYAALERTLTDAEYRQRIGAAARTWALQYHSKRVVQTVMERAMEEARENFRRKSCPRQAA
jgi:glycosyltransferase involved in cell wall biosynthesis